MACTTILIGKDASYDGAPMIARNEDSANGEFNPKRFIVTQPEDQPRLYHSVLSHLDIELPNDPLRYTSTPNADLKDGIWGEAGINSANVAMTATETITSNERVLGADPFVEVQPAKGKKVRTATRHSCQAASLRRTSSLPSCHTFTPPAKVSHASARCSKSTAPAK